MRNALRSIARSERSGHINLTGLKPTVFVLPSRNREFANFVTAIENNVFVGVERIDGRDTRAEQHSGAQGHNEIAFFHNKLVLVRFVQAIVVVSSVRQRAIAARF